MKKTFIELCVAGEITVAERDDKIDDYVGTWHDSGNPSIELHEFLGLSEKEYAEWVQYPQALSRIVQLHMTTSAK